MDIIILINYAVSEKFGTNWNAIHYLRYMPMIVAAGSKA
jgi:hypothetical protein